MTCRDMLQTNVVGFTMEEIRGSEWSDKVSNERTRAKASEALQALWEARIAHNDIAPRVQDNGARVFLLDLGHAKIMNSVDDAYTRDYLSAKSMGLEVERPMNGQ